MQKLSIIIVNWNSGDYLRNCVNSVFASNGFSTGEIEIIIVDNASVDDSCNFAVSNDRIVLIRNENNVGFAKACNIGVSSAKAKYILLLNPDTKLNPDTLSLSLDFLISNPEYSVLGIKQINSKGQVQRSCCRIPNFRTAFNAFTGLYKLSETLFPSFKMIEWSHDESRIVDHVIGSFMMMQKSLWQDFEGMDEDYFLYYEDIDFSARLSYSHKKIYYWAGTEIYHEGGGTSDRIKSQRLYYSIQSRLIYVQKHFKGIRKAGLKLTIYFIEPFIRMSMSLIRLNFKSLVEIFKAYIRLLIPGRS